jgi:hypothetical protein
LKKQFQGCEYLDTSRKQQYGQAYRYGCGLRAEGYISTWINTDRLLSEVSCKAPDTEDDEVKEPVDKQTQMTIFDYPEVIPN